MCRLLSLKKCRLIVLDIRKDLSESLKNEVESNGGQLEFYECDLTK